jgi:hypothetical protein
MKKFKFVLIFFIPTLIGCPIDDDSFIFRFSNNSDVDVYIYLGVADSSIGGSLYPDTAIARVKCGVPFKKGESRGYCYKYDYDEKHTKILSLFIFNSDTFNTCNWDEIKKEYKIIKRYDISLEYIKSLSCNISYPPTEEMKNIYMFPPYNSNE